MKIKFTVPNSPKGNVTLPPCRTRKKREQRVFLSAIKFGRELPARATRWHRICKLNGRSAAYTPKETIEYEKLIRAMCVAARARLRQS